MDKRHGKNKHRSWNDQRRGNNPKNINNQAENQKNQNKFKYVPQIDTESIEKRNKAIQELKAREIKCPICGEVITDISSALSDKTSGAPVHFECVMAKISETEKVGQNEKICYIGQGRFGLLYFENPRDQRHFTIKKIIDWEEKEKKLEWRDEISSIFSQVE